MDKQELTALVDAKRSNDPWGNFYWSLVSPENKYLFVMTGKVASVTTTVALRELDGNPFEGGDVWEDDGVLKLRDFTTDEIVEMLTSPDWFRFCFVRKIQLERPDRARRHFQIADFRPGAIGKLEWRRLGPIQNASLQGHEKIRLARRGDPETVGRRRVKARNRSAPRRRIRPAVFDKTQLHKPTLTSGFGAAIRKNG